MSFDEQPEEGIYEAELHHEFERVMCSDAVARYSYDTAVSFKMDYEMRLKAVIVALSNANKRLMTRIDSEG